MDSAGEERAQRCFYANGQEACVPLTGIFFQLPKEKLYCEVHVNCTEQMSLNWRMVVRNARCMNSGHPYIPDQHL
jgi:hypothetical protein